MATTELPGLVSGTIQILTRAQAKESAPDLFEVDQGIQYFHKHPANGNPDWVDFWPEHVLLVRNDAGDIVTATPAGDWYLRECGYDVPATD